MQCEVCGGTPLHGVELFRVNPKGQKVRWRCIKHATPDDDLRQIVETISEAPENISPSAGYKWCSRTDIRGRKLKGKFV